MTTLDWSTAVRYTLEVYPWAWVVFVTFVLFSAFIVYNLIVAVVCDTVGMVEAITAEREQELSAGSEEMDASESDGVFPESEQRRIHEI
jgi:voltage-gated sodium channel